MVTYVLVRVEHTAPGIYPTDIHNQFLECRNVTNAQIVDIDTSNGCDDVPYIAF